MFDAANLFYILPSIFRSRQKQRPVGHLSLDCVRLESDSPVLGSELHKHNEPANLPVMVRAIARFQGSARGARDSSRG
jgi:Tat protein secretion system quality control protein TatD with DNase activity